MVHGFGGSDDSTFKWNDNGGEGDVDILSEDGASASSEQSLSSKRVIVSSSSEFDISEASLKRLKFDATEAANQRLKQTPLDSTEKVEMAQILLSLRPLGLTLDNIPPFLDVKIPPKPAPEMNHHRNLNAVQLMTDKEKLKASNFSASLLRIGSWQRSSHHENDVVAKCYYAKRKLVWEILDRGLKSKIEIPWSDILAMRAVIQQNEPGILEIELAQPPSFHRESDPKPRKHTMWNVASDFTNGQAVINRRHYLQFLPGVLDKHYEKLILCESRFFELSQMPFPSQSSPYFQADISIQHSREIPSNIQLPYPSCIPMRMDSTQQIQTYEQPKQSLRSPISVMDSYSPLDEVVNCQGVENHHMSSYWDQGLNRAMTSCADFLERDQLPGSVSANSAAQLDPAISYQNFNLYNQGLGHSNLESRILSNLQNQLLIDSQHRFNHKQDNSLIGFPEQLNPGAVGAGGEWELTDYPQEMTGGEHIQYGQEMIGNKNWGLPPPLPANWVVPPQGNAGNGEMHMAENNSAYPSFPQNPTVVANFSNLFNRRWHDAH